MPYLEDYFVCHPTKISGYFLMAEPKSFFTDSERYGGTDWCATVVLIECFMMVPGFMRYDGTDLPILSADAMNTVFVASTETWLCSSED